MRVRCQPTAQQGQTHVVRCQRPPGAGDMLAEIVAGRLGTPLLVVLGAGVWTLQWKALLTVTGCLDGAEETSVPRPSRVGDERPGGPGASREWGPLAPCGSGGQRGCWAGRGRWARGWRVKGWESVAPGDRDFLPLNAELL